MNRILARAVAAFNRRDARRRQRLAPGYTTGPLPARHVRRRGVARPSSFAAPSRTVPMTAGREPITALAEAVGVLTDRRAPIHTGLALEAGVREGMRRYATSSQAGTAANRAYLVRECAADDLPFDQDAAEVADLAERIANGEAA